MAGLAAAMRMATASSWPGTTSRMIGVDISGSCDRLRVGVVRDGAGLWLGPLGDACPGGARGRAASIVSQVSHGFGLATQVAVGRRLVELRACRPLAFLHLFR